MMEKHYAHNMDLHMLFVDFRKAFDSVNRERLYEAMKQMQIPDKLIRVTRMTMNNTQAKIKIDKSSSSISLSCDRSIASSKVLERDCPGKVIMW
jgi:hypothetical protein